MLLAFAHFAWEAEHAKFLSRVRRIRPGTSESTVVGLLGKPTDVHGSRSAAPDWADEYWDLGYRFRRRPISHKVLVYLGPSDYITFVYLGQDGRVHDVVVGGT
jgi:hypothetical protein